MKYTRRQFVKATAMGAAGILAYKASLRRAFAFNQSPGIPLFGTTLRGVGPGGIPVALPTPGVAAPVTGVTRYNINIDAVPGPDRAGFDRPGPDDPVGLRPDHGLGDLSREGSRCRRTWVGSSSARGESRSRSTSRTCSLIVRKASTSSPSIRRSRGRTRRSTGQPSTCTAAWSPGSATAARSTGSPLSGQHGLSFLNNQVLNPKAPPNSAEYYYPMNQSARFLWYHDHAVGITRLNAYAGIASGLLIRDNFEAEPHQPGPAQLHRGRRQRAPARHPGQDLRRSGHPAPKTRHGSTSTCRRSRGTPAASGMPTSTIRTAGTSATGRSRAPESIGHPRVLRRHDAGERHDLPAGHRPGAPLPPAASSTPQRPVPQPAALRRRRQPERDHPGWQRHPDQRRHS